MALHQRGDFLLLLLHRGEEREPLLAREIAGQTIVRFFLAIDLGARRKGLDVDRDVVVEQRQPGETLHQAGMRDPRPATEHEDRMVKAVHPKARSVGQSLCFAVPAVLLNRKRRIEGRERVVVEARAE